MPVATVPPSNLSIPASTQPSASRAASARIVTPAGPSPASASRIRVLPDLLVNKIAAGEVIDRPASVVKELLENAIDAGATRIAVAIEEGGRRLIRVTDDACGMSAEDLRLAVTPHATSKLLAEDDLYSIRTLGFRGEALASIAAVSQMRIVSKLHGQIEGHEIRMAGDRFEACQAAGSPEGTTVEIRDLFFNVPARRKFLRAAGTESGHIGEHFARVALANPQIGFELSSNGRTTQNMPACSSRLERIAKFYGAELSADLMHVERGERGIGLDIFAAPPVHARATAQWQYLFVNGRFIRDRSIQHAIKEAYRGLMEPDRHGVVFVFLTVDPSLVDVNVHPTKIEVRWADSQLIYSQVLSALRETFQRCELTPRLRTGPPVDPAAQDRLRREFADSIKAMTPPPPTPPDAGRPPGFAPVGTHGATDVTPLGAFGGTGGGADVGPRAWSPPATWREAADVWRPLYGLPSSAHQNAESAAPSQPALRTRQWRTAQEQPTRCGPDGVAPSYSPAPRAVQMHNLYLVAETEEGIVIIDQHALHERVMYEELRERFSKGPLESQRLLLPETVRVTAQQAALLEAHAALLEQLGIEITPFGSDSIAVHAFPPLLKDTQVVEFMRDLLDLLAGQSETAGPGRAAQAEIVIHKVLDLMACKAAVKAGDPLSPEEIQALLRQRHLIEKSSSCPHGRPTTLRLTKEDLNRQFKRT